MSNFDIIYRIATDLSGLNQGVQDTAKATEQIDSKLQSLTTSAASVGKALGIAFGAAEILQGVISLGREILADADALEKMHDKTGISEEGLQRLRVVGDEAGNTLEELAGSVNKFQKRLEDHTADEGLRSLGLSVQFIKSLNPDEQFLAIGKALEGIDDPARRVAIAVELFGKSGAEVLPSLLHASNDLKDGVTVTSSESVKALDALGDAFTRMWRNAKSALAEEVGQELIRWQQGTVKWKEILAGLGVGGGTPDLPSAPKVATNAPGVAPTFSDEEQQTAIKELTKATEDLITKEKELGKANQNLNDLMKGSHWDGSIDGALKLGAGVHDLAIHFGVSEGEIQRHKKGMEAFAAVTRLEVIPTQQETNRVLEALGTAIPQKFFSDAAQARIAVVNLESAAFGLRGELSDLPQAAKPALTDVTNLFTTGQKVLLDLNDSMREFPKLLISAFTGGGSVAGAFQALGTQISSSLFKMDKADPSKNGPLAGVISSVESGATKLVGHVAGIGSTIAGLAGSVASGVATMGISLGVQGAIALGKWISGIGKASQAELDARKSQDGLIESLRGMATQAEKTEGALTDNYHTIAIVARDAFMKTGLSADQAGEKVKALLNTHDPQAFAKAMADLNDVLGEQEQDAQDLNAAIQRYGFSIEELGPAMQKQQLDDQAKQLINDWRVLVASGIDLATVNIKMASTMQGYLDTARKTGQEVPQEMKPVIQSMIDQGVLVDANGAKITDMTGAGITFSETMTQGFDKVVAKLDELITKLGGVGKAVDAIPSKKDIAVDVKYNDPGLAGDAGTPTYGRFGGLVDAFGVQAFKVGGVVMPRPTWPDTVPAMLSPGELVLTKDQQRGILDGHSSTDARLSELMLRLPGMITQAVTAGTALAQ